MDGPAGGAAAAAPAEWSTAGQGAGDPTRPSATPPGPGEVWTVLRMILWSAEYLGTKGVERARLDAEYLLATALDTDRLQLYLQFDRPLEPAELARFRPLLKRRASREPLQYIQGRAAFRELDLRVDPRVLIPRPETEGLVEHVLEWGRAQTKGGLSVWDIGTGSGVIAISLRREGPFDRVVASDKSPACLELGRANGEEAEAIVEWREGDLFDAARPDERFDVVVSNPPYIALRERAELAPEVRDWEPGEALVAGPEGLDVLARLVEGAGSVLTSGGLLALEIGAGQGGRVLSLAEAASGLTGARIKQDLTGRDRYLLARRVE